MPLLTIGRSAGGGSSTNIAPVYNVKLQYGAAGDGSTDDTTAIQNAINAAGAAGGGIVYLPEGTYRIATGVSITSPKVIIRGAGPRATIIKADDVAGYVINFGGSLDTATNITADATVNTRALTVTSSASFAQDDWVLVDDAWQISSSIPYQEAFITRLSAITDGTHVQLEERLPTTMHTANTARLRKCSTWLVGNGVENLQIQVATSPARPTLRDNLIGFSYVIDGFTRNVILDGSFNTLLWVQFCRDFVAENILADHGLDKTGTTGSGVLSLNFDACTGARISNCSARRVGQGLVMTRSVYCTINGNVFSGGDTFINPNPARPTDGGGRGIKLMACSYNTIAANTVRNFPYHLIRLDDSSFNVISANVCSFSNDANGNSAGVSLDKNTGGNEAGRMIGNTVIGNEIRYCGYGIRVNSGGGTSSSDTKIIGNTVEDTVLTTGVGYVAVYCDEDQAQIIGNTIRNYASTGYGIWIPSGRGACLIEGNKIRNGGLSNAIRTSDGTGGNRVIGNDTAGETNSLKTTATADLVVLPTNAASANPSM